MEPIPHINKVEVIGTTKLLVSFDNGELRVYDCEPLFSRPQFQIIKNPVFFRAVRLDSGGYGISWNDDIDLSEYELWTNGKPTENESLERMG